jgi:hypothetical protein
MSTYEIPIDIGGMPIGVYTTDSTFATLLRTRYKHFVRDNVHAQFRLDVETTAPEDGDADEDVSVTFSGAEWLVRRGDFRAHWDPIKRQGSVRQSANPYSIDAVLRIVHSLILAGEGGFLLHGAGAIRNGRAFVFSGVSGAGKTTISSLAPADVVLLTDEISYIRPEGTGYRAFGTPFAGELAQIGQNVSAPLDTLFLLAKGPENRVDEINSAQAVQAILRNVLFFAEDDRLVRRLFDTALDVVAKVKIRRLTFVPDQKVWELVG